MSVVMVLRFKVEDIDKETLAKTHDEVAAKVNELGKSMGVIHHDIYYSAGTGEAVVIDEWPSAEDAEKFWSTDTFRSALGDAGMPPPAEVYVLERVEGNPSFRF